MTDSKRQTGKEEELIMEVSPVTGLLYNKFYFRSVREYLEKLDADTHCMVAIDLEHFRMFNKLYGRQEGNRLLEHVAEILLKTAKEYAGVAGYLGGDNFAILMPYCEAYIEQMKDEIITGINQWNNALGFWPAMGVYQIGNLAVTPEAMYDKATLAASRVIGNYAERICIYNEDMEDKLEQELQLLSDIQEGLEKEEFIFYVQPQCNISTGQIVGGEALVRWKHSTKGMVSPAMFIPVVEKNGFVTDLDCYVWKKVCQWLRSCIDRGFHPVPVSINVSRIDIYSMDVAAYLKNLLETYELPARLLKVEITESAYTENNDRILRTVKQLRESDFLVMMDDFGSGYSSLNLLKSVAVDVLKLDMRFLEMDENNEEKGLKIIRSVVNMARQLQVPIVVEGVETQKQEEYLRRLGCRYTQGYYYYRPLPVEEFEKLLADEKNLDFDGFWYKQVESMHVNEFLDTNLFTDDMLNNILGPAAFYDLYENQLEIIRVNEPYYKLAGVSKDSLLEYKKCFWEHIRDDDRAQMFAIFEQAYDNKVDGADGYLHFVREDGTVCLVYCRIYFMREKDGHKVFYGSLTDMSSFREKLENRRLTEKQAEKVSEKQLERMERYYGDMPCGYAILNIMLNEEKIPEAYEIVYANKELQKVCGGDVARLHYVMERTFADNKAELLQKLSEAAYKGETVEYYVHSSYMGKYLKFIFYQYEYGYASCILQDETHKHVYEDALENIVSDYREVYFMHIKDNYLRMIYPDESHLLERGNYEEVINRHMENGRILPYDEHEVRKFLSLENVFHALEKQDSVEYKYRRSVKGEGEEWCQTTFSVRERENGKPKTAIVTIRSIEALMREREDFKHHEMAQALSSMSDGFFIYSAVKSEKILYVNPAVLKMYGCQTMTEFRELVDNSFRGMVHPDDLNRIEWEIRHQVRHSEKNMDFITYRIIRRDGEVRWIDDCGHLEDASAGENGKVFYVFISDITDTITEEKKKKLLELNKHYNA